MLRIAVQAKGRLYDETMSFLGESDIKLSAMKRSLLVQSSNFPLEVLFLRDDRKQNEAYQYSAILVCYVICCTYTLIRPPSYSLG